MPTKTTDLFEIEHIEYVTDRSVAKSPPRWMRPLAMLQTASMRARLYQQKTRTTSKLGRDGSRLTADSCASSPSTTEALLTLMGITGNRTGEAGLRWLIRAKNIA